MGATRLERLGDPAELLAVAEPLEPRTTHLVDALLHQPRWRRRIRVARDGDGSIVGAVVLSRLCLDRWFAHPLVLDPSAAPALAAYIDRSPAWLVLGFSDDVEPVQAILRRGALRVDRDHTSLDIVTANDYGIVGDERTRVATPADLDRLVALYAEYELDYLPTMARLRRDLRRDLARDRVILFEDDGAVVGAYRIEAATRRFHHWSHLTVHPDHRGRRLGSELSLRSMFHSREQGVWVSSARHPSNPLPPPDGRPRLEDVPIIRGDRISEVRLRRRVPALRKAWRALELLEGPRRRRPKATIDPERWERARDRYGDRTGASYIEAFEERRAAHVDNRRERG